MKPLRFLFIFLNLLPLLVLAQVDGRLDSSFGNNGTKAFPFASINSGVQSSPKLISTEPGGSLTILGTAIVQGVNTYCVSKLRADGAIEAGFGSNGKVCLPVSFYPQNFLVAVRTDTNNCVIVGCTQGTGINSRSAFYRFLPSGLPDPTFGVNGKQLFSLSENSLADFEVLPDNKIIALGTVNMGGSNTDFFTWRLDNKGLNDSSYNDIGYLVTSFSGGLAVEKAVGMYLQSDGKILAAGNFNNGLNDDFALMRLDQNGSPDTSFGTGGKLVIDYSGYTNRVIDIAEGPNHSILILATIFSSSFAVKLLPNGQPDISFGINGRFAVSGNVFIAPFGSDQIVTGLTNHVSTYSNFGNLVNSRNFTTPFSINYFVPTDSGMVFCVGTRTFSSSQNEITIIRLKKDISFDYGFDATGILTLQQGDPYIIPIPNAKLCALAIQADKKILYLGSGAYPVYKQPMVVRLLETGNIDTGFGVNGIFIADGGIDSGQALAALTLPDLSILLGGYMIRQGSKKAFLLKLKESGEPDTSFGNGGWVFHGLNAFNDLKIQFGNRILAAGPQMARFYLDGRIDSTFGVDGTDPNIVLANKFLVQADDKILIAGDTLVCRLLKNGGLDPKFYKYSHRYYYTNCSPSKAYRNFSFKEPFINEFGHIIVSGYDAEAGFPQCFPKGLTLMLQSDGKPIPKFEFEPYGAVIHSTISSGTKWLRQRYLYFERVGYGNGGAYNLVKKQWDGNLDVSFGPASGRGKIQVTEPFYTGGAPEYIDYPYFSQWQEEGKLLACMLRNDSIFMTRHLVIPDTLVEIKILPRPIGSTNDTFQFQSSFGPIPNRISWSFNAPSVYLSGTDSSSPTPFVKFPMSSPTRLIQTTLTGYYPNERVISRSDPNLQVLYKPIVDFAVNRLQGTTTDTFVLNNLSTEFPDQVEWRFSPDKAVYGLGMDRHKPNIHVVFPEAGVYDVTLKVSNFVGADSLTRTNYIQVVPSGLSENYNQMNAIVFPNPSSGKLNLVTQLSSPFQLRLVSAIGEKCLELHNIDPTLSMDLSHLAAGLYYLQLTSGTGTQTFKIILNKE